MTKKDIEIYIEYQNEKRVIDLDPEKRLIKCFPKPTDITVIEILDTDELKNKIKYLKKDYLNISDTYESYISKEIYVFHHPYGGEAECSKGEIIGIDYNSNNTFFLHNAFTAQGSSGSAIILADCFKIVGIHCKKNRDNNINYGVFIDNIFDEFREQKINPVSYLNDEGLKPAPSIKDIQLITLRYKRFNSDSIRIFGNEFVQYNKGICKIIVGNKTYELCCKMNINKMKKIGDEYEIKLEIFNNLTNLSNMFNRCDLLSPSSEIGKINTSKVKNISYLFSECRCISKLPDISSWNIENVDDMSCMFAGCQKLISIPDISKWNTSNVRNMMGIFAGCISLQYAPDISNWNTNKVCKMDYMFYKCYLLKNIPDISKWDTRNVISMSYMCYYCTNISCIPDISKWNTSNVKYIEFMFAQCQKLLSLPDFSSWDTRKIQSMQNLFENIQLVKRPIKFPKVIKRKNKKLDNHTYSNYFGNLVKNS